MLGLYVDSVPHDAKKRIVRWKTWGSHSIIDERDMRVRDLLGVAEDWHGIRAHDWDAVYDGRGAVARRYDHWCPPLFACTISLIGDRWDRLVNRVGLVRAVELVKARASKSDRGLREVFEEQIDKGKVAFT